MDYSETVESVQRLLEAVGIGVIIIGVAYSAVLFARTTWRGGNGYRIFRQNTGRSILLGLEVLIAADIVGTVGVNAIFESIGVLAGIVAIRTFLSFTLELEIEHHWPWEKRPRERRQSEDGRGVRDREGVAPD